VGKAIAVALARAGAEVIITYHASVDQARATVAEIERSGGRASAYACDQSDVASIMNCFQPYAVTSITRYAHHNGDYGTPARTDVTLDDWERVLNTNLRGPFFMAQAAARWLIEAQRPGVTSTRRHRRVETVAAITHTISKTGLVAMTETALALAPDRVNAIAPGPILATRPAG
jgi:NAD(P)-dependent dehydrogenase (short-subunit alcohol dehydrogenase family)